MILSGENHTKHQVIFNIKAFELVKVVLKDIEIINAEIISFRAEKSHKQYTKNLKNIFLL